MFLRRSNGGSDEHPEKMRQRHETVEHPFGTIKARMGAAHFLPDEDASTRRHRDGPARVRLQPRARHQHPGHQTADGGNAILNHRPRTGRS